MMRSSAGSTSQQPQDPWSNQALFAESNILVLTQPQTFQDTTKVRGARMTPPVTSDARGYFSGYVYRGDNRLPKHIFREGFTLQHQLALDQVERVSGAVGGITYDEGISTTVCAQVASTYRMPALGSGFVYLIDALDYAGFAIPTPRPNHFLVEEFPILMALYEVNFISPIPNTSIIGTVWPGEHNVPMLTAWPRYPTTLKLAVNPEYHGGMEGARDVVARFNNVRVGVTV